MKECMDDASSGHIRENKKGRKTVYLCRHLIAGRSQVVQCEIDRMKPDDYDEAVKLHNRATKGLSCEIFVQTPEKDMRRLLGRGGISLGVWFDGRLICMRAIVTDGKWVDEILADMGFDADPARKTVYTDHCVVDKDFRGNNIQFLTHYEMENRIVDRYETFYTTVSPKNSFSLQNILGCNFVIVGLKELYSGNLRYILKKPLSRCIPIWTRGHLVIPIRDTKRQTTAIAEGYVGYKLIRRPRGFSVLYAPAGDNPPKGYWRNMAVSKQEEY
ncbi:MAG: hypothetical protein FWE55_05480 [Synergistaceae bacterium]|nr:hypothetical protein [Synergistaceae bacterium]